MALKHAVTATGTNDAAKQVSVDAWNQAHAIDSDGLTIPAHATVPATPAAGNAVLFTRTLANRTMLAQIGPSGIDAWMQPHIGRATVAAYIPHGTAVLTGMGMTVVATGTATAPTMANTNLHTVTNRIDFLANTAAATAVAGYRGAANRWSVGAAANQGGFLHIARFAPATGVTVATRRLFAGLRSSTAAATDVQPSSLTNIIGVGYDAADTTFFVMHNAASTTTKVNTSITRPAADRASAYSVMIFRPPNSANCYVRLQDEVAGTSFETTITTNLPANTTFLNEYGYVSVGGTSSVVGMALFGLYTDSDH